MRGLVSHAAKRRIEALLSATLPPASPHRRVAVLCYHSIEPATGIASVSADRFGEHLDWLTERCDVVPLQSVPERAGRTDLTRPSVAVTFDDGYRDNFAIALDLLTARGIPASFFITTGLIEGDPGVMRHLGRLWGVDDHGRLAGMAWSEVRELQDAGMDIGAHTHTHPNLARTDRRAVRDEVVRSKELLEQNLGTPIETFAYPFGKRRQHYTQETVGLVEEAGFRLAVTVHYRGVRSSDGPLEIPRFAVTGDSISMLEAKVSGKLDVIGMWQTYAPHWIARAVSVDPSEV